MKSLPAAKQRLALVLPPEARRRLVLAMLSDVLAALAETPGLHGILVISADAEVQHLAVRAGAQGVAQAADIGLVASAMAAARVAAEDFHAASLLLVPADLACATAADFAAVLAAHAAPGCTPGCTIVPSWDARGTNCLAVSLPNSLPFLFGPDSFRRHLAAAAGRGLAARVVRNANLGRDIDTPADLRRLAGAACGPQTRQMLRQMDAFSSPIAVAGTGWLP